MMSTRHTKRKKLIQALGEMYGVGWGGFDELLEEELPELLELGLADEEDDELGLALEDEEGLAADEDEGLAEDEALGSEGMVWNGSVEKVEMKPRTTSRRMTIEMGWRKTFCEGG